MILVIDNYDSFTYNLVQYIGEVRGHSTQPAESFCVRRNDAIDISGICELAPEAIILSPGPCTPDEAGISMAVAKELAGSYPILGVCLGHQAIAQAYGAKIIRAEVPRHGKTSLIHHNNQSLFSGLKNDFPVGRYHSLVIDKKTLPSDFSVLAESDDQEIMAIEHAEIPSLIGLQFHPESLLTPLGKTLLKRFFERV